MTDFPEKERQLERCIRESNTEEAVRLLLDLVTGYAGKKDFQKAELFRDRLYDIDTMALSEIIKANEIIAEEKSRGIDTRHREIWAKLYDTLKPDEGNALYSAFEEVTVQPHETVFRQGESCSSLYLVNLGRLSVTGKQGPREILISRLGPGSLFGSDNVFSDSLCTTTITALSTSKLFRLDKSALTRWQSHIPGIEPKLKSYCRKADSIPNLLLQKGMDRRAGVRMKIDGKAAIQFLGNSDELIGKPFRGELCDISSGGISFLFRITGTEKARLILGRKLVVQLRSATPETPFKILKKGTVVAVHPRPFGNYSFHISFDSTLSDRSLETIVAAFSRQDLGLAGE